MIKKVVLLFCIIWMCSSYGQSSGFRIFPDFGYSYQKTHVFNVGFHPAIARYDSTMYLQSTYAITINAEINRRHKTTYLAPCIGVRGYNDLFGSHRGIAYGVNVSNYHELGYRDWLLTPEVGLMWKGLNFMVGYSFNLDPKELDFYHPLKLSLRITI